MQIDDRFNSHAALQIIGVLGCPRKPGKEQIHFPGPWKVFELVKISRKKYSLWKKPT